MDRRHDDGEPPFNGCREANTVLQEGDSDRHRRLSRNSPDDSRTRVNSSAFPASLKDGGEMPAATGTSGSPNGGRGADLAIFPSIGTHSSRLCCSAPHAGTGGHSGRSSAISREPPGHLLCVLNWLP